MSGTLFAVIMILVLVWLTNVAMQEHASAAQHTLATASRWMIISLHIMLVAAGFVLLVAFDPLNAWLTQLLGTVNNPRLLALALIAPSLIALLFSFESARTAVSKIVPIEPNHHVHTLALLLAPLLFTNTLTTLAIGLESFADALTEIDSLSLIVGLIGQNLLLVMLSFIGVGWLSRRNISTAVTRLKLTRPTFKTILIGIGMGWLLLLVMGLIVGIGTAIGLGNDAVTEASEALYEPLMQSFVGIMVAAIAAPIGEEILFRGAIQPRFGRLLTAFLFAITHANYGLGLAAFAIFAVGYGLGIIRDRWNTTAAIIAHGTFNGIQVTAAYIAFRFAELIEPYMSHGF